MPVLFGFFIVTVLLFGLIGSCANSAAHEAGESGYRAGLAGVPSNANPHQGHSFATEWLDGWMRAQREKSQ